MLDAETKSRINSARDILVGKVPDPKSQVEQITIALIYKFMDDMDRQSEELGGKATFFSSKFKKYRWANLLDKRFGGHERLLLYAEGIEKMDENKNIPRLFRDIFKGVFLPYRDPETLNLFLKEIDGFTYDHSERLGDAYEYLLSVLGTQGDAGQFRTPRHIIDFIVAVVDPQKHETVLDPACGTAGFLISAFKHIVKTNENLTPDERARLMTNFGGYDIAPDMVRLSRVNLYLHGFPNPVIHEYDTLTSEERWDERCDVIMANPPFMTPKGGIRPHNRFAVKAKRSEVLFVDYIAEHLNPGGRAGVIVPEGIIFQSQNAYKALRKMLIENYLWAVVSLPAGVFNPYSGVKTSILFLDRNLARRTEDILFVKVQNDGFDLGAQRRPIEKNNLPQALKIIDSHKKAQEVQNEGIALTVSRKRLLESADMNLSGDRYRVAAVKHAGKWPMVKLGEVCTIIAGQSPDGKTYNDHGEGMPFHQGKTEFTDTFLGEPKAWTTAPTKIAEPNDVVISVRAPVGPVNIVRERICIGRGLAAIRISEDKGNSWFLFHILRGLEDTITGSHGAAFASINRSEIEEIEIPLPPLDEQERIVAELEGYRKIIEGGRQVIANYKPTIRIDPKWPKVKLEDVCRVESGFGFPVEEQGLTGEDIPFAKVGDMNLPGNERTILSARSTISRITAKRLKAEIFPIGTVIFPKIGAAIATNKKRILGCEATIDNNVMGLVPTGRVLPEYLLAYMQGINLSDWASQAQPPSMRKSDVEAHEIPLPDNKTQQNVVAELEAERALVKSNRKLIEVFEKKIQSTLAEIWGEEKLDDA